MLDGQSARNDMSALWCRKRRKRVPFAPLRKKGREDRPPVPTGEKKKSHRRSSFERGPFLAQERKREGAS